MWFVSLLGRNRGAVTTNFFQLNRWLFYLAITWSLGLPLGAATIPGLYNTGVATNGALATAGAIDPHYKLVQSPDANFPGPIARVLTDSYPLPSPWMANGPASKWIAPLANQGTGNAAGDYKYRTTFNLTGLDPTTAVITGQWTSDNAGTDILLNGASTHNSQDGNFGAWAGTFTITGIFQDGINTLDFVVNNAGSSVNPTGLRVELSGTADPLPPPGTPPTIKLQPASQTNGLGDSAVFTVQATGSRPLRYQWRFNSLPLARATNATLVVNDATQPGTYDVVVSNDWGAATSNPALLALVPVSPAQLSYEPLGPSTRRTGLTLSEIMYHPRARADALNLQFIELYNSNPFQENISGYRLTGAVDYTFPSNTVIAGRSFLVIAPAPADVQAAYGVSQVLGGFTNSLPNDTGAIRLRKKSGALALEVAYADQPPWPVAADGAGHSLVLARPSYGEADPRAWAASAFIGGSPGAADPVPMGPQENVMINEVLAHTAAPMLDFVELYNHSGTPLDLSGCWLTDDPATNKFRIPDSTMLDGGTCLAFDEQALGFGLKGAGETVYFVNQNQTRVIDAVRFGGQALGVSCGRFPDGAPGFHELAALTPGQINAPLLIRGLVINEIMFHPISGNDDDQYVELYNRGADAVALGGWRFTAGIGFTFPASTVLGPDSYLVVAKNA
jgi:hypothetical protein